jgi:hypothetical protein
MPNSTITSRLGNAFGESSCAGDIRAARRLGLVRERRTGVSLLWMLMAVVNGEEEQLADRRGFCVLERQICYLYGSSNIILHICRLNI